MKVAVYSAIFGSYEQTAKPLPVDLPCPAIMFTDSAELATAAEALGWRCAVTPWIYDEFNVDPANGDPAVTRPMLAHKYWKTHPTHAGPVAEKMLVVDDGAFDVSIWLDGNMQIKVGGVEFVERCLAALGPDDWSAMRHPWRNCIYTEAEYTATVCAWRYSPEAIRRQAAAYEAAGYPRGAGLQATGFMVRRHTPLVEAIGEAWWQENLTWSHQDQISLPFVLGHARDNGATAFLGDRGFGYNEDLPWGELWDLLPHGS